MLLISGDNRRPDGVLIAYTDLNIINSLAWIVHTELLQANFVRLGHTQPRSQGL